MKKTLSFLITSIFISCGNGPKQSATLSELTAQKANVMKQIDSLSDVLNSIELKITKLDTTKRLNIVTAIQAKEKIFRHYLEVQGNVEADQSVELYPERSGTITQIFVKEGQTVFKGQNLVQIDDAVIESSMIELQTSGLRAL